MIVLDFDGVLFNDTRFKKDHAAVFARFGISRRRYEHHYREVKKQHGGYRHHRHINLMRRQHERLNLREAGRAIDTLVKKSHAYVYHDALPFLNYAKKRGINLALVSNGDGFQKKKVAASGLLPFFRHAIVAEGPKSRLIRKLPAHSRRGGIVFIDDKKSVLEEVQKNIPGAMTIQIVRRAAQERSTQAHRVVRNLTTARRLIG